MSLGKYSKKNGCVLNRGDLNWIFGKKTGRPDAECWEMQNWLRDTIAGSDVGLSGYFYIQGFGDVAEFMRTCGITQEVLRKWFAQRRGSYWVVVEKQNDAYVWSWFTHSRQMGEWKPIGEDCPIIYKLVPREDGKGSNKVLIE
jgi:hypothetical protein